MVYGNTYYDLRRVKAHREVIGMSRRELAKKAQISYYTLQRLETGKHEAQPSTVGKLAAALDVPWQYLVRIPL